MIIFGSPNRDGRTTLHDGCYNRCYPASKNCFVQHLPQGCTAVVPLCTACKHRLFEYKAGPEPILRSTAHTGTVTFRRHRRCTQLGLSQSETNINMHIQRYIYIYVCIYIYTNRYSVQFESMPLSINVKWNFSGGPHFKM